jgi:hypothetical protein
MLSAFVPSYSMNTNTGNTSNSASATAARNDVALLRSELDTINKRLDAGVNADELSEMKKFSDFLKFRLDALDTRVSGIEKANSDINSKMNIIEITMTALSAVLKNKAGSE